MDYTFSFITVFLSWMIVSDFCVCLIKMKGDILEIVQHLVGACYYKYYTSIATSLINRCYGFNYGLPSYDTQLPTRVPVVSSFRLYECNSILIIHTSTESWVLFHNVHIHMCGVVCIYILQTNFFFVNLLWEWRIKGLIFYWRAGFVNLKSQNLLN